MENIPQDLVDTIQQLQQQGIFRPERSIQDFTHLYNSDALPLSERNTVDGCVDATETWPHDNRDATPAEVVRAIDDTLNRLTVFSEGPVYVNCKAGLVRSVIVLLKHAQNHFLEENLDDTNRAEGTSLLATLANLGERFEKAQKNASNLLEHAGVQPLKRRRRR